MRRNKRERRVKSWCCPILLFRRGKTSKELGERRMHEGGKKAGGHRAAFGGESRDTLEGKREGIRGARCASKGEKTGE